jgi:hypothetical protein
MTCTPPNPADHYQATLHGLIDQAANLARRVHDGAAETPTADDIRKFDRAARCARFCIMLAQRVVKPSREPARRQIIRAVEDNIHRHADIREAESLRAELEERLGRPDFEAELDLRPAEEIITEIVRDLGLAAIPGMNDPWQRRTPEDIEDLHARAAKRPCARHGSIPPHPA